MSTKAAALVLLLLGSVAATAARIPVIIDTDIGSDFDDSVALAYALQSPDLDVKLVLTATGDTATRAAIVAKYLVEYGRTDVPIGIGVPTTLGPGALWGWQANLSSYPGTVHPDGVGAAIAILQNATQPVQIVAIAPATNFPSLLQRFPGATKQAQIKAMSGSVYRGYGNSSTPSKEYNVALCPSCTETMYSAGWDVTITPLDTCGTVTLQGDIYDSFLRGSSGISQILTQSLVYWARHRSTTIEQQTDVWFDAVAVYLTLTPSELVLSDRKLTVTADGFTVIDPSGTNIHCALSWNNETAWEAELAGILATPL